MINFGTSLLKIARRWYRDEGFKPFPLNDANFDDLRSVSKQTVSLGYEAEPESDENVFVAGCCIPMIAAIMEDVDLESLSRIAMHYGADQQLASFIEAFGQCFVDTKTTAGRTLYSREMMIECIHAIEVGDENALVRAYWEGDEYDSTVTSALLNARSQKLWPVAFLRRYQRAVEQDVRPTEPLYVTRHNLLDILDAKDYPKDDSGIRYDWLLERSGMLLPEVIKKTLGAISLWEELVWIGTPPGYGEVQKGFVDYCIDKAPLEQRPMIKRGLQSMILETSHISDGAPLLDWMRERFAGTFLAEVSSSIVLQVNMIRGETNAAKAVSESPASFNRLAGKENLILQGLCNEIGLVSFQEMGMAHFKALAFLGRADFPLPIQTVDAKFGRESFLCHVLEGIKNFAPVSKFENEQQAENYRAATLGVEVSVKLLSAHGEFDYKAFSGLDSRSASILAVAGLDLKRLPKMTIRDKGRVLEQDLGM